MWPNLIGFRVISHRAKDMDRQVWDEVCEKLNALTKVRHFALYSRCSITGFDHGKISFLPQVRSLDLAGFDVDLKRLRDIRHLSLYHMQNNNWHTQMQEMSTDVTKNLIELTIYPANEHLRFNFMETITTKFTSLQYLHIRTRLPLKDVIQPLARLTKLKHLRIWNYLPTGLVSDIPDEDLCAMPVLESVEIFHLYIRLCNHLQLCWISHVFPQLKWIKFDRCRIDCSECYPANEKRCEHSILAPLKKCPKLRRIYLDRKSMQIENCAFEYLTQYDELSPTELADVD